MYKCGYDVQTLYYKLFAIQILCEKKYIIIKDVKVTENIQLSITF